MLLFQCTADREPELLLGALLAANQFQLALFCSTRLTPVPLAHSDSTNLNLSDQAQRDKCEQSSAAWRAVKGQVSPAGMSGHSKPPLY